MRNERYDPFYFGVAVSFEISLIANSVFSVILWRHYLGHHILGRISGTFGFLLGVCVSGCLPEVVAAGVSVVVVYGRVWLTDL